MKTGNNDSRSGSALIVAMIFTVVSGTIAGALLTSAVTHRKIVGRQLNREQALSVAEAGSEYAAQQISAAGGYLGNLTTGSGTVDGQAFAYSILKTSTFTYRIFSTSTVNNVKWKVVVDRAELPSWAKYALWMHENGEIYFIGGEVFNGHVHSNDKLWFALSGSPQTGAVFHGELTSANNSYGGTTNKTQLDYGLTLNAEEGAMAQVNFSDMESLANSYGLVLQGNTKITFSGTNMKITNSRQGWNNYTLAIGTNNLIYVKTSTSGTTSTRPGTVSLGGTVDGRVTVVADVDINITNHVKLAQDSKVNTNSNDAVGLIAKDDISVTTSAPNNVQIFAAMIAAGQGGSGNRGSFGVASYNSGSARGDLNVHGSIVQDLRGAVGTFNSSGTSTGFAKKYSYDTRFGIDPPPYYPRLDSKVDFYGWQDGPG